RQIESGFGAGSSDYLIKQPDILMHAQGVFHRQRALLLQHDVVVTRLLDGPLCLSFVPVHAKGCATGLDQLMLKALSAGTGKLRNETRNVVAGCEAVADEEYFH